MQQRNKLSHMGMINNKKGEVSPVAGDHSVKVLCVVGEINIHLL
jgi:hypothetical protein